jgi:hypothetical protein
LRWESRNKIFPATCLKCLCDVACWCHDSNLLNSAWCIHLRKTSHSRLHCRWHTCIACPEVVPKGQDGGTSKQANHKEKLPRRWIREQGKEQDRLITLVAARTRRFCLMACSFQLSNECDVVACCQAHECHPRAGISIISDIAQRANCDPRCRNALVQWSDRWACQLAPSSGPRRAR